MGLSRRAYAALRGVHESAVRKAIATGRITTEADGTIDAAKADAMWDASTDPAKQRGAHARDLGRGTAAVRRHVVGKMAVPLLGVASQQGLGGLWRGQKWAQRGPTQKCSARHEGRFRKAQKKVRPLDQDSRCGHRW